MERIKREVNDQDRQMTKQAKNLKAALIKTVNPDGLKTKITEKFMGFLRINVNKVPDDNSLQQSHMSMNTTNMHDTSLSFMDESRPEV